MAKSEWAAGVDRIGHLAAHSWADLFRHRIVINTLCFGFRRPTLNPTAANTDKEAVRWSRCWLPDGRCDSFTKGRLYCSRRQLPVYMGSLTSIAKFSSASRRISRRPCYATKGNPIFNLSTYSRRVLLLNLARQNCANTRRMSLSQDSTQVLQTEAALTKTGSATNGPRVSEAGLGGHEETHSDHQQFPLHEREKQSKRSTAFLLQADAWRRVGSDVCHERNSHLLSLHTQRQNYSKASE